jgi:hypothetical protein
MGPLGTSSCIGIRTTVPSRASWTAIPLGVAVDRDLARAHRADHELVSPLAQARSLGQRHLDRLVVLERLVARHHDHRVVLLAVVVATHRQRSTGEACDPEHVEPGQSGDRQPSARPTVHEVVNLHLAIPPGDERVRSVAERGEPARQAMASLGS